MFRIWPRYFEEAVGNESEAFLRESIAPVTTNCGSAFIKTDYQSLQVITAATGELSLGPPEIHSRQLRLRISPIILARDQLADGTQCFLVSLTEGRDGHQCLALFSDSSPPCTPRLSSAAHALTRPSQDHHQLPRAAGSRAAMAGMTVTSALFPPDKKGEEVELHLEALQRWHDDTKLLWEVRTPPRGLKDHTREQVTELVETLIEEKMLDIRRGSIY
ncbi:uncharacterized protein LOC119579636 [Penaeus monodon]|uniref:uncharacterized protein LOC119579636 n=1 Tax=Penaeus monodon TaxID=6687 RepID=UPI0018A7818D|nr:uncharacterized protein LOC119579636 [Penaeus monodon]